VQLTERATHVDAEGPDSDLLAWAADLARGPRTPSHCPGAAFIERLRQQGRGVPTN
jgi:hypothetical protein